MGYDVNEHHLDDTTSPEVLASISMKDKFTALRSGSMNGLISRDSDTLRVKECSKKDVCLLMREVDMDFYRRATGEGGAEEAKVPVTISQGTCEVRPRSAAKPEAVSEDSSMLTSLPDELITLVAEKLDVDCLGNFAAASAACKSAARDLVSMVTLTKEQCQEEANALDLELFDPRMYRQAKYTLGKQNIHNALSDTGKHLSEEDRVPGCLILKRNGKILGMRYNLDIWMSILMRTQWPDVTEPVYSWVIGSGIFGVSVGQGTDLYERRISYGYAYEQICYKTSRLSAADANYYSPYKLKRENGSPFFTRCPSPICQALPPGAAQYNTVCSPGMMAELFRNSLTTSPCAEKLSFESQAKYQRASDAIAAGDMAYAQALMEKNVLFDRLTNKWCPEIWAEVQLGSLWGRNSECSVKRRNREPKVSMTDASCLGIHDETLASITDMMDASKPTDWELDSLPDPIAPHWQNAALDA